MPSLVFDPVCVRRPPLPSQAAAKRNVRLLAEARGIRACATTQWCSEPLHGVHVARTFFSSQWDWPGAVVTPAGPTGQSLNSTASGIIQMRHSCVCGACACAGAGCMRVWPRPRVRCGVTHLLSPQCWPRHESSTPPVCVCVAGPAPARGEPRCILSKPAVQDQRRGDVRHLRQVRAHSTDPCVSHVSP